MMPKYIDAEALKAVMVFSQKTGNLTVPEMRDILSLIDSVPAADVEPVRHGRWIHVPGKQTRVCSRCETDEPYKFADEDTDIYSWCPRCGARMDGGSY